jgi:hypothetical protein
LEAGKLDGWLSLVLEGGRASPFLKPEGGGVFLPVSQEGNGGRLWNNFKTAVYTPSTYALQQMENLNIKSYARKHQE